MEPSPPKDKKRSHIESNEIEPNIAEETLCDSISLYPKIIFYCIGLSSSFLLSGYDTVIVGTVTAIPRFQQDFGELFEDRHIIPSVWMSLWSALGFIGSIIGAAAAGPWQDRSGRRWPLAWGSLISAAAIAILYVSNVPEDINTRRGVFLFGKIVQGFAIGVVTAVTQTYISETVPTSLRGPTMALFPTFTQLGQLVGAIAIYVSSRDSSDKSYLVSLASQWPFSAVPFAMALLVPESPAYLVRRDRSAAALRSERRLHGSKVDVEEVVEQLQQSIGLDRAWAQEVTYRDCFRGANARRTLIVVFSMVIPVLFGLPLLSNASYYLQVVGMSDQYSLVFLILGIGLGLLSNGIGVWMASRIGRRPLTVSSLGVTTVLWLSMGIAGCWNSVVTIWYTAVTLMIIIIICSLGAWPASYAIAGETSSLRLRAKTQGLGILFHNLANIIFNLILPYIYNPDSGNLRAMTGFVYAGFCVIAVAGTWFWVPEMKGRSVGEIDAMFELRVRTRDFVRTRIKGGFL
ncbi:uncharacterized protein ASPGLDRAFT_45371 [Aspergillus glaucus CBS 516.65]|uniref:Major facilitator superfamily (MFS) profile domain-containing protein n=1 Tax=Aspergillus glaucus CBS 516.65 TaxID=1160497 RepID=A0A1L9VNA8_ASPGL|nr:hypothetical protein ASPGLDRAFT_45371 [Aspergillus glaucus CBS 516.65]OJJ85405.1 hypothetical protein ASPGLDRAFT_45371 [Aspergillus glaucus CBS 516.65]